MSVWGLISVDQPEWVEPAIGYTDGMCEGTCTCCGQRQSAENWGGDGNGSARQSGVAGIVSENISGLVTRRYGGRWRKGQELRQPSAMRLIEVQEERNQYMGRTAPSSSFEANAVAKYAVLISQAICGIHCRGKAVKEIYTKIRLSIFFHFPSTRYAAGVEEARGGRALCFHLCVGPLAQPEQGTSRTAAGIRGSNAVPSHAGTLALETLETLWARGCQSKRSRRSLILRCSPRAPVPCAALHGCPAALHAAILRAAVCCTHACVCAPFLALHLAWLSVPPPPACPSRLNLLQVPPANLLRAAVPSAAACVRATRADGRGLHLTRQSGSRGLRHSKRNQRGRTRTKPSHACASRIYTCAHPSRDLRKSSHCGARQALFLGLDFTSPATTLKPAPQIGYLVRHLLPARSTRSTPSLPPEALSVTSHRLLWEEAATPSAPYSPCSLPAAPWIYRITQSQRSRLPSFDRIILWCSGQPLALPVLHLRLKIVERAIFLAPDGFPQPETQFSEYLAVPRTWTLTVLGTYLGATMEGREPASRVVLPDACSTVRRRSVIALNPTSASNPVVERDSRGEFNPLIHASDALLPWKSPPPVFSACGVSRPSSDRPTRRWYPTLLDRPTTVQGFFDLLDTSSSAILSDVQALELVLTSPQLLTETQMQNFRRSPKLTVLRIDMQDMEIDSLCATVPSVSTFRIQFDILASLPIGAIASAVSAFPSLEILQLRGHEITMAEVVSGSPSSSLARLHTVDLGINYHGADHFFSIIQSLPVLPVLKTLDLNIRETHLGGAFELYIRNKGRDIQQL
ncbi:hypothetical protein FB451DRAFT_1185965 [Mycena latifolia]|nr:hypothetical protein FB451DRAFT_1185965 [Mycena latifolia]